MKNIVLVGFMGTGKTCVARELAKRLNKEFIEVDELIEKEENSSINGIFNSKGEAYFRQREKEIAKQLSNRIDAVISTGGGIVLNQENIDNLKKNGVLICLEAKPKVIFERIKKETHRPLLKVENPLKKIEELLGKRKPFYQKINFHIDTSDLNINQVADKVIEIYSKNE